MKLMGLGCKKPVSLQSVDDPVDIRLGLHSKPFGNDFIRRSYPMYADIRLDEVQNKLSARCHASSLNVLTNVRKWFKQNIYTPGVCVLKTHGGGGWDANVTAVVGDVIGGVDHSAVCGGGGKCHKRGMGVRQGRATPAHHTHAPFTRNRLHALHARP